MANWAQTILLGMGMGGNADEIFIQKTLFQFQFVLGNKLRNMVCEFFKKFIYLNTFRNPFLAKYTKNVYIRLHILFGELGFWQLFGR